MTKIHSLKIKQDTEKDKCTYIFEVSVGIALIGVKPNFDKYTL